LLTKSDKTYKNTLCGHTIFTVLSVVKGKGMKLEIQNTVCCTVTDNLLVHGAMKFMYKLTTA